MPLTLTPADRPLMVTLFEWLSIITVIVQLIVGGFAWDALIWAPLTLWIILSITRRRSRIARWIFSAFYVFGFLLGAYGLASGMIEVADVTSAAWGLTAAAIVELWLVWSGDSSRWIASRPQDGVKLAA